MSEFSLKEKKEELYRKYLHGEIKLMEYINKRNDLDKEFIRQIEKDILYKYHKANGQVVLQQEIIEIINKRSGFENE